MSFINEIKLKYVLQEIVTAGNIKCEKISYKVQATNNQLVIIHIESEFEDDWSSKFSWDDVVDFSKKYNKIVYVYYEADKKEREQRINDLGSHKTKAIHSGGGWINGWTVDVVDYSVPRMYSSTPNILDNFLRLILRANVFCSDELPEKYLNTKEALAFKTQFPKDWKRIFKVGDGICLGAENNGKDWEEVLEKTGCDIIGGSEYACLHDNVYSLRTFGFKPRVIKEFVYR